MRPARLVLAAALVALAPSAARAWSEQTHQKMVRDAVGSLRWLDAGSYQNLKATSFSQMMRDVLGAAEPAPASAFKFFGRGKREQKRQAYLASTAGMADPNLRAFARHLMLSNQFDIKYTLGESRHGVSAREIIAGYSGEPDWGMDKGLDASRDQALMGGTNPQKTSSQGFRHMSFLFGLLGQSPQRAQLMFDLGKKAIQKGHPYWGFRFVAWGLHYLEDMGTPVHTSMLPTTKYIRLQGMVRPTDGQGAKLGFNKNALKDVFNGSVTINSNYHFLYEHYVEQVYGQGKGPEAKALSAAVAGGTADGKAVGGRGREGGLLSRLFAPQTVKSVARRRGWSRLATPSIARNAIRFFTDKFRQPAPGRPSNTVFEASEADVEHAVAHSAERRPQESPRQFQARLAARDRMMQRTARELGKNGLAIRRAMEILHRDLARR